ncbi:MAG: NUDIX domain-containing protein [Synergistaceae bacterium]|jgi:8-oxo-dGTP diphosphatase|nr:NUDIX domain-containing protein [Synergistaceae bacterium]
MASWSESAFTVLIVFCFLVRDGKILLITRANEPYRGSRTIPGGKKLRGESLREACIREMREETGLTIKDPKFAGLLQVCVEGDDKEYVSAYFTANDCEGTLEQSEEGGLEWVDFDKSAGIAEIHPSYAALFPLIRDGKTPFSVILRTGEGRADYGYE